MRADSLKILQSQQTSAIARTVTAKVPPSQVRPLHAASFRKPVRATGRLAPFHSLVDVFKRGSNSAAVAECLSGNQIGNSLDGNLTPFERLIRQNHAPAGRFSIGPHQCSSRTPVTERRRRQEVTEASGMIGPVQSPAKAPWSTLSVGLRKIGHSNRLIPSTRVCHGSRHHRLSGLTATIVQQALQEDSQVFARRDHPAPRCAEGPPVFAVPVPAGGIRLPLRKFTGNDRGHQFRDAFLWQAKP